MFSDQQHKYALGRVTREFVTPNLDRLADTGVLFENAYSPNPVCGPYRGCLMTGQLTCHCRVYDNCWPLPDGVPTMAQVLNQAGYETSYVGKWHLGGNGAGPIPEALRGGFRHFIGYQCYNGFDPAPPYSNRVAFYDENNCEHVYDRHRTDVTADLAVERLEAVARTGRPFFLAVSFQAPHYPEQPGAAYEAMYENVVFPRTEDEEDVDPYTPTFSPYSPRPYDGCPDYRRYGGNMQKYKQLYAGMVSQVDAGVGRILDALHRLGHDEDTLVIYTSDHGDMQGSHGLKNKCYPHEKSAGVPFLARCPGGVRGLMSRALVSGVDIFPTILEAAGIPRIDGLDGHSFLPYLQDGKSEPDAYVISEYVLHDAPWRMVRTPRWKLTVSMRAYAPVSLYDMEADPYEMHDLKDDPACRSVVQALTGILRRDTCEIGDTRVTPEMRAAWYPAAASSDGNS